MGARGRRKRPAEDAGMYVHQPNVATTYEQSADGRRVLARSSAVDTSAAAVPSYHAVDKEMEQAMERPDFSYLCGAIESWDDNGWQGEVPAEEEEGDADGITLRLGGQGVLDGVNFERWEAADTPMQVFMRYHRDETLDEMLRLEGRGSPETCIGAAMYCEACIVNLHRALPTHSVEMWSGEFFIPLSLNDLGLDARIQLGHPPGTFCPRSRPAHKDFVIIDVLGIRVVKLSFCGCDSRVEHRQQLERACLWPATSVDPQTCATTVRKREVYENGTEEKAPPDRRRAFRAIVRQYRMMELRKRAGRGHENSGIKGTCQGELAEPKCRMCPIPEVNLPADYDKVNWDEEPEDQRYKYFLSLAQDANFKLINRNVSTEEKDPVHVDEEEISSCSGFQAMFLANAKRIKGLRVTGVGGVTCARHNMWRPNGIGDLQMGERYCNMDFLFFSALLGYIWMYIVLSYDIACQFSKNIWTRMGKLPEKYHIKIDIKNIRWAVPNFHLPAHKKGCHDPFSFHWLWGAGRTHGETVEQNWEFVNGIAASTKMMGLGARHTALEGLFSFHNFRRLVAHRRLLLQRMAEGIKEGRAHKESFQAFNDGVVRMNELDVEGWKAWVDRWEREQHVEGAKDSPYELEEDGMTLKEIRILLAAEEYARTGDGTEVEHEDTPSTFVTMGMEIEETQRQLAVAIKAAGPNPSPTQELDFLKRRTSLRMRLQGFRKLQLTYMPKLRRYLSPTQRAVYDADDQQPEATRLFMPSEIGTAASRGKACAPGLDGVEARLRQGEVGDALSQLRQGLRVRTMTNRFKIRNWSGQRALTRGTGYIASALLKLKGHGQWEDQFRVLEESDVRALSDREVRDEEQAHDAHLGALGVAEGLAATGAVAAGETHRTLSWIWYAAPTKQTGDKKLHEAIRVEWCKAYSRSNRWREDLVLVEEEMRRTLEYGRYAERQWKARAEARTLMLGKGGIIEPEVKEGVRAYALEQADRERRICARLEREWGPMRAKAAAYLRGEDMSGLPDVVVDVDEDQLRWAEARVYTEEEVENDMYQ
ncbi:hypothetical protein C8F04DRAFT_1276736 [Mycena alexandri]|uniref:CxC2-like cysteine cluster KDZ transposase-associated domain-containing protein n=1 Tax=Mycena alexandri TaxID=1745969 RepID=A0AAD6S0K7_9AGAR|nr:hypothetical protein C8F04DRAFT_1276736 [Mycena alexandri]